MVTHEQHKPSDKWVVEHEFLDGEYVVECRVFFGGTMIKIHPIEVTKKGKNMVISFMNPYHGKVTISERKTWRAGE